ATLAYARPRCLKKLCDLLTIDYQLKELLPSKFCQKYYYRFQTDKLEPSDIIDDTSYRNIQSLKTLAQTIIETQDKDLEELCQQLSDNT
ncbi:hypothetical protein NIES2101_43675, partial [Calothrix sp. HK-06]